MIRIDRGEEPQKIKDVRNIELPRVATIAATKPPSKDEIGERYNVVKGDLWELQGEKCAYCETKTRSKRNDVEHYRPKTEANRAPGSSDTHGYWWLAWSWSNLLFACSNCNQPPAKGIKFPLDIGSESLAASQHPPGKEFPLLIDPAEENGISFIQFKPVTRVGKEVWVPTARNGHPRGDATIRICNLDAPDLITAYTSHIEQTVKKNEWDPFKALLPHNDRTPADRTAIWEAWECMLIRLLSPHLPYVGLSYDALDRFLPVADRERWGVSLRLP